MAEFMNARPPRPPPITAIFLSVNAILEILVLLCYNHFSVILDSFVRFKGHFCIDSPASRDIISEIPRLLKLIGYQPMIGRLRLSGIEVWNTLCPLTPLDRVFDQVGWSVFCVSAFVAVA